MALTYTINADGNLLKVKTSGFDEDLDDALHYAHAIIQAAQEKESTLIFCDERDVKYTLSTIDTYTLADSIAQQVTRKIKLAIVCKKNIWKMENSTKQ